MILQLACAYLLPQGSQSDHILWQCHKTKFNSQHSKQDECMFYFQAFYAFSEVCCKLHVLNRLFFSLLVLLLSFLIFNDRLLVILKYSKYEILALLDNHSG